jgi:Phosphotransferase enzyme family
MTAKLRIAHPKHINRDWAEQVLAQHNAQAEVRSVALRCVDIGTTTRVNLAVDHDADELPAQWFIKLPSLSLRSRLITALPRFLHKEICFYQRLAAHVPVRVPRVIAGSSRFGAGSTLVMADLSEQGIRPGLAGEAVNLAQAERVVEQLAALHAYFWDGHALLQQNAWLSDWSHQAEVAMGSLLAVPLMRRGLHLGAQYIDAALIQSALHYAAHRRQAKRFLAQAAPTLVHYDCHPGNLFWDNGQPGFLDWQLTRLGEGVGDVAYFLANALETPLRRQHERALLLRYVDALAQQGVKGLNADQVFNRYRAHLVYPFEAMVVTLAIGGMMHEPSNIEMIRRSAAAVTDNDSFALIDYR